MAEVFVNNYASTLASAVGSGATVLPLVPGGGAPLAAAGLGSGATIRLTIIAASNPNTFEIVNATGLSGDNVTVVRAQEGTTALAWNPADIVACLITAGGLANFVSGAYVLSFATRQGAVVPLAADYAAFYPELVTNNTYTGNQQFHGTVTVQAGKQFQTGNIIDLATGSTGVEFFFGQATKVAETISGGFQVDGNLNVSGTINRTSSLRYKEDVRPLEVDLSRFLSLEPIAYRLRKTGQRAVGFSAEQVHELAPELVTLDAEGRPDAVNYDGLIAYMWATIRDQAKRIEHLEGFLVTSASDRG